MNRNYNPFRWFRILFIAFLVLIGAAVLVFAIRFFLHPLGVYPTVLAGPFFWFFPFPFFGLFIVFFLIFGIARWFFFPWRRRWGYYYYRDPAMEALRERYARGEISKEQFDQMSKDLEQH